MRSSRLPRCSPSFTRAWMSSRAAVTATVAWSVAGTFPAAASSFFNARSTASRLPGPAISRSVRSASTSASASSADSRNGRVR